MAGDSVGYSYRLSNRKSKNNAQTTQNSCISWVLRLKGFSHLCLARTGPVGAQVWSAPEVFRRFTNTCSQNKFESRPDKPVHPVLLNLHSSSICCKKSRGGGLTTITRHTSRVIMQNWAVHNNHFNLKCKPSSAVNEQFQYKRWHNVGALLVP